LSLGPSVGALACLGCGGAFCFASEEEKLVPAEHKFLADSQMTFEEVFKFTYQDGFVPVMQNLARQVGREKLLEMLQQAASDAATERMKVRGAELHPKTPAVFVSPLKQAQHFTRHVLTLEVVEETEKAAELKVTECLWAKTFREAGAADIGYAVACHPDHAAARAFNPRMRMIRTKTLMEGHDCCNHRFVLED
jgi:predicted hydrocarbon binding protein